MSGQGPVQDLDGTYERWFAEHGCEAFLARPDFYVFAAGEHTDIPRFVSRLRQALQPASEKEREPQMGMLVIRQASR